MANVKSSRFVDSDSDEEDFNPQPAVGSDDGRSDDEVAVKARRRPQSPQATPPSRPASDVDDEDPDAFDRGDEDRDPPDDDAGPDEREGNRPMKAKSQADDGNDDDEDEDDEDDDDEEEDEDNVVGRPRKRARRDPRNQFIDIEAEVDDEDEGDEDEDEEAADFIAKDHPDDVDDLQPGTENDDRRHRELDRKRELEQQMDAEKQAALLKERYGRRQAAAQQVSQVPRRLLLPSVNDPSIWGVRCKPGKEKEVVYSILKRWEERFGSKNPLPIFSAFERGSTSMTGYVYVEARKQSDIMSALDGILFCYPRTNMVLVAIKEMPDLLRVTRSEQLQPGGYVRLRAGKYKGDLAQIDEVESNGLEVTLRIVPRLDYGLNEDVAANGEIGPDGKRKRGFGFNQGGPRPPQRFFSEPEARKRHQKYLKALTTFDKKQWEYLGETYVNGYLIKDFKIQQLQTKNTNPTLEEVSRFASGKEDGTEHLDLTALAASLKNNSASDSYLPGDTIEIYEGEQAGITGKAVAVRGDIVTIRVSEGDLRGQTIDVPIKGIRKRFRAGDHVKIIGGSRFLDEVGMVVSLKGDQVTLVSDLTMQEITVFSKDLREATDTGAAGGLGRYDIHDLVQLDPATVGCVTKVDRESMRVLDQNGGVRTVMPSQISNKIERRRNAVATDRNGAEIRQDDTVKEIGGENKQGVIVHIHRSFLFCHNREQTENSGVFVVRATNVTTVAAKGGRVASQVAGGPDLNRMNPAMQRNGANGAGSGGSMPPPQKTGGRDRALGQTVTIRKGPYKGLLGIVKDTTDSEARVELHTKGKTIQIPKDTLGFKDPISGNSLTYNDFAGRGRGRGGSHGGGGGGHGGPSWGGATPSRGGAGGGGGGSGGGGADWGSRTPMAAAQAGGRTPAWGGSSSRTPAWSGGGGGGGMPSRTPAWGGGGGRTPAWGGDGSRTAYGGGDGSRTAYGGSGFGGAGSGGAGGGGGGRTPAWGGDGGRTPAYSSNFGSGGGPKDAPTPAAAAPSSDPWRSVPAGAATADTPGAMAAPTPGAWRDAPTPAGPSTWRDAPTPAASAPTPFAAETPGAWEDEGPRYVDDEDDE